MIAHSTNCCIAAIPAEDHASCSPSLGGLGGTLGVLHGKRDYKISLPQDAERRFNLLNRALPHPACRHASRPDPE